MVGKYRMLIADDSLMMREFIKANLAESFPDVEIVEAVNGTEAQQKLQAGRSGGFDAFLCDWEMPEMSGEELLQWIRATEGLKDLPFVMITAKREREAILAAVRLGVTDYIVKPFTPDVFCQKLKLLLRKIGRR